MPQTIKLMFDGEMHDCLVTTADNGETICYRKDRQFVKFPKDVDLEAAANEHNASNSEKPVTAEEAEAKQAELDGWFDE